MPDFTVQQNQISADIVKRPVGKRIHVLLADDHTIVRQGLRCLLQLESDFEVVGEAENGRQAIDLVRQCNPEVVIMDLDMPVMNGIEATRILAAEMPHIKVIVLSMYARQDMVSRVRDAGAIAYLTKGCPVEELVEAVRACLARPPKAEII